MYQGAQKTDRSYVCWIIDCHFDIVKVRATYKVEYARWFYKNLNLNNGKPDGGTFLQPCSTGGNWHSGGFGHHYKCKKDAIPDQQRFIKEEIKRVRSYWNGIRDKELDKLQKKL